MWLSLFNDNDSVLLLGEGNFSFAKALCKHNLNIFITATCYEDDVISSEAEKNIEYLRKHGVTVLFGVDATKLSQHPGLAFLKLPVSYAGRGFQKILFNFPHVGGKMRLDLNRSLLKDFFISCNQVLQGTCGKILVTLCNGQGGTQFDKPRRRWDDTWKIREMAAYGNAVFDCGILFPYDNFKDYRVTGYRGLDKEFHMENAITHVFHLIHPVRYPTVFIPTSIQTREHVINKQINKSAKSDDHLNWLEIFKDDDFNIDRSSPPIYLFDITFTVSEKFDEIDFFLVLYNNFGEIIKNVEFVGLYEFPKSSKVTRTYRLTYYSLAHPLYRESVIKIHSKNVASILENELSVIVTR